MASRQLLQSKLEELLGSENVYYQPPENLKMEYPCIRYSRSRIVTTKADNTAYTLTNCYEIVVISRTVDHPVINKLLKLPYCSFDRSYKSDNLNHDIFTLYY